MTYQELPASIKKLKLEQRLSLLEILDRSLSEDYPPRKSGKSSLSRGRGMLKTNNLVPTSKILADEYTDYLIEKYE